MKSYFRRKVIEDKSGIAFTTAIGVALGAAAGSATATAIGVGVTGLAAYGAFKGVSGLKAETASLPNQANLKSSEPSYDRASALAQQSEDKKRRSIARNDTRYTSPTGLTPANQSELALKTLTGT